MTDDELDSLRRAVTGPVLTDDDATFAGELAGWNILLHHHPDVAVGAATAADVVAAVGFALDHGLRVSVLATGHGTADPVVSGVLITTRRLDTLSIDPDSRIATIGAGVTWQQVLDAAAEFGLAPITGSSTSVGAVGYLLGGGLGPLARSHGFSSDYLRGITVVTGEGTLVEASATENSDLFWALRGGKVGLGIVTEVRVQLVQLATLYAGALIFDAEHLETAFRGWIDYTATAPAEVTTSAAILRLPDIPQVPAPLRGRTILSVRFAYPGAADDGIRLAQPLRELAPVSLDTVGQMPTTWVARIHGDPTEPTASWMRGGLLKRVDQDFASVFLAHAGADRDVPLVSVEVRHLGAATATDVPGDSAVGGRDGAFTVTAVGVPDPTLFEAVLPAVVGGLYTDLEPWLSASTTINFVDRFTSAHQFASCWPEEIFTRLTTIRHDHDPAGIFSTAIYA